MLQRLAQLDNLIVHTDHGELLRTVVVQQGLSEPEATEIEARYRTDPVGQRWTGSGSQRKMSGYVLPAGRRTRSGFRGIRQVARPQGKKSTILARANTGESGIRSTSPVAMYPLGASQPHGLMDLGGNVWEWTDSWYDEERRVRVSRGGFWDDIHYGARLSGRYWFNLDYSFNLAGFRLVSPNVSDS